MKAGQILSHIRAVLPSLPQQGPLCPPGLTRCPCPSQDEAAEGEGPVGHVEGGLADLRIEGRIRKAVTQGLPAAAQVWL